MWWSHSDKYELFFWAALHFSYLLLLMSYLPIYVKIPHLSKCSLPTRKCQYHRDDMNLSRFSVLFSKILSWLNVGWLLFWFLSIVYSFCCHLDLRRSIFLLSFSIMKSFPSCPEISVSGYLIAKCMGRNSTTSKTARIHIPESLTTITWILSLWRKINTGLLQMQRWHRVYLSLLGEQWRRALFTSSFWASSSRAPRTCCDPRSSRQMPSWRAGDYGRFTVAWFCWFRCCSVLTTCRSSAAACWSRRSWLSLSGRNSTMTQPRPPSCITGSVRPSSTFR